jgi:DNA modification methylase
VSGSEHVYTGKGQDILPTLPAGSVQCCVTSPPFFGLRDYGCEGQLGLEETPEEFVANLVAVFREVRRVLRDDGVLFLNLGDSYAGSNDSQGGDGSSATYRDGRQSLAGAKQRQAQRTAQQIRTKRGEGLKPKDLIGIPWMTAFALRADGWWLRSDCIWAKGNPMPSSVTDRPTTAHEYVFLLSKRARYYYDCEAVAEPATQPRGVPALTGQHKADAGGFTRNGTGASTLGTNQGGGTRNLRSVWSDIGPDPYPLAHFACFPLALAQRCLLAGSRPGDVVLDPFAGSGTVGEAAVKHDRVPWLVELNAEYHRFIHHRLERARTPGAWAVKRSRDLNGGGGLPLWETEDVL